MLHINEILEKIEERFINKLPTKEVTSFELGKMVGNQEVVAYILSIIEQDNYKKITK